MTSVESESHPAELCVRHCCYTKYLEVVNTMLTTDFCFPIEREMYFQVCLTL